MSGTASTLADHDALWAALSAMRIGESDRRFEEALASATGWTADYAARVVAEYRRFLYLAATAGREVTPSRAVDEAWHLHLRDEAHYRDELCGRILGRPLDHRPGSGADGEEARFAWQYAETLARYRAAFGDPPRDIWPLPPAPEPEPEGRRVPLGGLGLAALGAAALAAFAGQAAAAIALVILAGLLLAGFFLRAAGTAHARSRRDGGDCGGGGGCGGGDSSGDGGCPDGGASCGGGGCGGD